MPMTSKAHKLNLTINENNIPTCSVPGCNNPAAQVLGKKHPNYPRYRRSNWIKKEHPNSTDVWCCRHCHEGNTIKKYGVKSTKHLTAARHGMTVQEYAESKHPYLRYRKDYCENIDGRLGFKCNTVLPTQKMLNDAGLPDWRPKQFLEVDHIDGHSKNNDPDNLQTLCKHCHQIKSVVNKDYATIGRKRLKEIENNGN